MYARVLPGNTPLVLVISDRSVKELLDMHGTTNSVLICNVWLDIEVIIPLYAELRDGTRQRAEPQAPFVLAVARFIKGIYTWFLSYPVIRLQLSIGIKGATVGYIATRYHIRIRYGTGYRSFSLLVACQVVPLDLCNAQNSCHDMPFVSAVDTVATCETSVDLRFFNVHSEEIPPTWPARPVLRGVASTGSLE